MQGVRTWTASQFSLFPLQKFFRSSSLRERISGRHQQRPSFCPRSFRLARNQSRGSAVLSMAAEADPGKTIVVDYYVFGRAREGVDADRVRSVLEAMWSLQYAVSGVVAAYVGSVTRCKMRSGGRFDFAVVYRFSDAAGCDQFRHHEKFEALWKSEVEEVFADHLTLVAEQQIDNSLESIFRKGQDFEEGYDHVIVAELMEAAAVDTAAQFLAAVCEVVQSPEIGVTSACVGRVKECVGAESVNGALAMALHASSVRSVDAVEEIPPIRQMWDENGNGLIRSTLMCSIELQSSDNGR